MGYKIYSNSITTTDCDLDAAYKAKSLELMKDMGNQGHPYHGKFELEAEHNGDITSMVDHSGLTDHQENLLGQLEGLAKSIVAAAGNPSKVKDETEVESDL